MKKKICVYLSIACLLLCCGKMTTLAADTQVPKFCPYCRAALNTTGEYVGNWTETHFVNTGLYDGDKKPITAKCTVTHEVLRTIKYCPSCHGYDWHEDKEIEFHSSPYCPDYKK